MYHMMPKLNFLILKVLFNSVHHPIFSQANLYSIISTKILWLGNLVFNPIHFNLSIKLYNSSSNRPHFLVNSFKLPLIVRVLVTYLHLGYLNPKYLKTIWLLYPLFHNSNLWLRIKVQVNSRHNNHHHANALIAWKLKWLIFSKCYSSNNNYS